MKYVATISNIWVDGVKYRRGEMFETDSPISPARAELYVESAKPKAKRKAKEFVHVEDANSHD